MARKKKLIELKEKAKFFVNNIHDMDLNKDGPTDLNKFAKEIGIKRIKFIPLLSDGGVRPAEDGYELWINTEAPGSFHKDKTIIDIDSIEWHKFTPPIRFTIAHEIAHIIYYKFEAKKHESQYYKHNNKMFELECSKLASKILIDRKKVLNNLTSEKINLERLSIYIKKLKISPKVFISRLQHNDVFSIFRNMDGMISLLNKHKNYLKIFESVIFGPTSNRRFRVRTYEGTIFDTSNKRINDTQLPIGMNFRDLLKLPKLDEEILATARYNKEIEIPYGDGILPCRIESYKYSEKPLNILVLINIS